MIYDQGEIGQLLSESVIILTQAMRDHGAFPASLTRDRIFKVQLLLREAEQLLIKEIL